MLVVGGGGGGIHLSGCSTWLVHIPSMLYRKETFNCMCECAIHRLCMSMAKKLGVSMCMIDLWRPMQD